MHTFRRLSASAVVALTLAVAFAALAGVSRAGATHDTTPWSAYNTVATGANHQVYSAPLADGDGSVYFFYYDWNPNTGASNVWVSKFSTRGPLGNPVLVFQRHVNPTLPNVALRFTYFGSIAFPAAALDHNGNLYVAWASNGYDVFVSKSVDSGNSWGAPVQVSDPIANSWNTAPAITVTPDDTVWVAWHQIWQPAGYQNFTVTASTDLGATFSGATNVTAPSQTLGVNLQWHDFASASTGGLYIAYTAVWGSNWKVNFTWSADGTAWSPPASLNGGSVGAYAAIEVDAQDRIHVAWVDTRLTPSGALTFYYRRSDTGGFGWTMEMPVSQGRTPFITYPFADIAVHEDVVLVGWGADSPTAPQGVGYALSTDGGDVWEPEAYAHPGIGADFPRLAVDENGTFYATFRNWNEVLGNYDSGMMFWDLPPSAPSITTIARGTSSLTVTWSGSPEPDVTGYRLWRSVDGSTYALVATVGSGTTTYTDSGLSDGTYWYKVTALDLRGSSSHESLPVSSTVGQTADERFDALEAEIAALQAALQGAQGDIDSLLTQLDDVERLLGTVRSEQATATMSTLMLILLVIILVLLLVLFVRSRRPGMPQSMPAPPERPGAPMPPAPPQAPQAPRGPDVDDL